MEHRPGHPAPSIPVVFEAYIEFSGVLHVPQLSNYTASGLWGSQLLCHRYGLSVFPKGLCAGSLVPMGTVLRQGDSQEVGHREEIRLRMDLGRD